MTTSHHGRSTRAGSRTKTDRPRKPSKIQPILLDRLAHALKAHGVEMKRTDVLQVAAAAFGYHNANEFSAADLMVQQATALARATLPDGEQLIVLRDPIANTTYGVEQSFIEQVVGEERREQFGVSPYSHVLDLSHLPDLDLEALDAARPPAGATLHLAICEHKHGTSAWVARTKADLYAQIAGFCAEFWSEVERTAGPIDEYDGDEAVVNGYFDGHDRETLYVEEAVLPSVKPREAAAASNWTIPEHPTYRKVHHRDWAAMTKSDLGYRAWVEQQIQDAEARPPEQRWQTASRIAALSANAVVVLDIHLRDGDRHIAPGMLGRIQNVVSYGGMTTVTVKISHGAILQFVDGERGGVLPFFPATCLSADASDIQCYWLTGRLAAHDVHGLKPGDIVRADIDLPGTAIAKDAIVRVEHVAGRDGEVQIRLRSGDETVTLSADRTSGVFPLMRQQSHRFSSVIHPMEDWHEAVAQRATGASYETWSSERRIHKVHLAENWLTTEEVRVLKPGQTLAIRIYGSGTAFNDQTGETYEANYAPGEIVTVDTVFGADDMSRDPVLACHADNGIEITLAGRNGYLPVAYPPYEASGEILSKKTHLVSDHAGGYVLTTGDKVHTGSGNPLVVVGVAEAQPLHAEGLLLFKAEDDIVYIARYRGRWELYPASQITHDQLRKIGRPEIDEEIVFDGVDCHIEAADFSANQPLAGSGIIVFTDQYREPHLCQRDGDHWAIVQPHELTDAQAKAVDGLI